MFLIECEKYDPGIFANSPISVAFSLAGEDPLKLDDVMNMTCLDAQKLIVLKAKNNFLMWYQNKILMDGMDG